MANQSVPETDQLDNLEGPSRFRKLNTPFSKGIIQVILISIPILGILYILGIHQRLGFTMYIQQYVGLFLALVLAAVFIYVPGGVKAPRERVPWYDWVLAVLGLVVGLYVFIYYPQIVRSFVLITPDRLVFCILAVLIILEAIRRVLGYIMLTIVLVFILYALFAPYFPGIFQGTPTTFPKLVNYLYLDANSMLSLLSIAGTIGLAFILFGNVMLIFKGGDILNNFALGMFGRFRGGPAKGAIIGSSLAGSISGSPVMNVVLTGSVTIPLMKRNKMTAVQAGAIESVASTGGQIMPPVMGVAAFIIAENLGIPYAEVALAALIPAILYYCCLFFQVDFMAARQHLHRLDDSEIPSVIKTLRWGWVVIPPLLVLIYLLFFKGMTPHLVGIYSSFFAVVFLLFQKDVWNGLLSRVKETFIQTGKMMLDLGVVLAAAGMVVGATSISGLGFNMAFILATLGEHGLFLLLLVSAIVSLILGMGMPAVAAYSLVAVLVAPAISQFGIPPLAAHLFVFYFSILSSFTPPIAIACFAAAPIAQASPHRIGFQAMQLGIVSYIVPFLFVYSPGMLILRESPVPWWDTLLTFLTALLACYVLASALEGYLLTKLNGVKRIILMALSAGLFMPVSIWSYSWLVNIIAFGLFIIFFIYEWLGRKNSISNLSHQA